VNLVPAPRRLAGWPAALLRLSYPVLAISTGTRAAYQLAAPTTLPRFGPLTTALAAALYTVVTLSVAVPRRWTWVVAVAALAAELAGVLFVGSLSLASPQRVGSSVWRWYGIDYGFFPLVQPVLGLAWLAWPGTRAHFGWRPGRTATAPS
jgi:hypothetical protein